MPRPVPKYGSGAARQAVARVRGPGRGGGRRASRRVGLAGAIRMSRRLRLPGAGEQRGRHERGGEQPGRGQAGRGVAGGSPLPVDPRRPGCPARHRAGGSGDRSRRQHDQSGDSRPADVGALPQVRGSGAPGSGEGPRRMPGPPLHTPGNLQRFRGGAPWGSGDGAPLEAKGSRTVGGRASRRGQRRSLGGRASRRGRLVVRAGA